MTGEMTLSGNILPVGGITQKVLAAHRSGIKKVLLPEYNFKHNIAELPANIRESIEFISVHRIDDVFKHVFVDPLLARLWSKL